LLSHFQGGVRTPPFHIDLLHLPCPPENKHDFSSPITTTKDDIYYTEMAKIVYDRQSLSGAAED
jgi:hypothetical protein